MKIYKIKFMQVNNYIQTNLIVLDKEVNFNSKSNKLFTIQAFFYKSST